LSGEQLRKILRQKGYSQAKIAQIIGMSQQSFNQMLTAADIKSGLLEKIVEALGENMSLFYPISSTNITFDNGSINIAERNKIDGNIETNSRNDTVWKEKVDMLERLLDEKERVINLLMKK